MGFSSNNEIVSSVLFGFIYFPSSGLNRTKSHIRISLLLQQHSIDVQCAPKMEKKHCKVRLSKNEASRIFVLLHIGTVKHQNLYIHRHTRTQFEMNGKNKKNNMGMVDVSPGKQLRLCLMRKFV